MERKRKGVMEYLGSFFRKSEKTPHPIPKDVSDIKVDPESKVKRTGILPGDPNQIFTIENRNDKNPIGSRSQEHVLQVVEPSLMWY